jgi:putative oxidoreductase
MWRGLRPLFSTYPRGLAAAGLLLLRIGVGVVLLARSAPDDIFGAAGAASLIAGFLTPLAALAMAAALAVSIYRSHLPELSIVLLIGGSVALALLGPGAWSVDARLFGRREIVIARR